MLKSKLENIEIKVLGLNHENGEYEEVDTGSIKELFFKTYHRKDKGLFIFDKFGYTTIQKEISIFKDNYESEDDIPSDDDFIKEFEKDNFLKINTLDDVLIYGYNDNNMFYINVSSCNTIEEVVNELNGLVECVCGNYPTCEGVMAEITIEMA